MWVSEVGDRSTALLNADMLSLGPDRKPFKIGVDIFDPLKHSINVINNNKFVFILFRFESFGYFPSNTDVFPVKSSAG
jgi:hypothetical protein